MATGASPATLYSGSSCNLAIDFVPLAPGEVDGSIVFTDNSLNVSNSTQTIGLVGSATGTAPTNTLAISPNPAAAGQQVTFTATLSPAPTSGETVSFYNGSTLLGVGTVNESGVATFSGSYVAGTMSVTAVYVNGNFSVTSSAVSLVITEATTTALTVSPNPATAGQTVTFTATVSPAPTGSGIVSFYNGSTLLGTGTFSCSNPAIRSSNLQPMYANSCGAATFTTSTLSAGLYSNVTAVYSGNSGYGTSTSSPVSLTVNAAVISTATTLVVSPEPATAGQTVTLTATVSPTPTGTPIGTVSFYNGSTLLGTGTVNSSGVATFTTNNLPTGTLSLTAVYSGNSGYAGSNSAAVTETVNATSIGATTTTLAASPATGMVGMALTLTATVSPAPSVIPGGTVSFYNGTTLLGTGTVSSLGVGEDLDRVAVAL